MTPFGVDGPERGIAPPRRAGAPGRRSLAGRRPPTAGSRSPGSRRPGRRRRRSLPLCHRAAHARHGSSAAARSRPWAAWPGDSGPDGTWRTAAPTATCMDERTPSATGRRILLAVDLTPASRDAANEAIKRASDGGAELIVLSVVEQHNLHLPGGGARRVDQERDRLTVGAQAIVRQARDAGVRATFLVWEGDPAEAILEASRSEDVDVIVLGSRPRTECPPAHPRQRLVRGGEASDVRRDRGPGLMAA